MTEPDPEDDGPPAREPSLDEGTVEAVLEEALSGNGATPFGRDRDDGGTGPGRDDDGTTGGRDGGTESGVDPGRDGDGTTGGRDGGTESGVDPGREVGRLGGPGTTTEETISRPLADRREPDEVRRAELRRTYGYVRAYFKSRPGRYRDLQLRLQRAHIPGTYDTYLTESARVAAIAGILGWFGFGVLAVTGVLADVVGPLVAAVGGGPVGTVAPVTSPLVAALVVQGVGAIGVVAGVWGWRNHVRPRRVVSARRRSIDLNLPYAITFLYALSRGGTNLVDGCRRLADADVYGEAATEFEVVVREIDLLGNDLLGALHNVRTLTPSDDFRRFLDDLLGVLESGGDLEAFLKAEAEAYFDEALEEQERFVETLGVLSELFVVAFVAAPLFLVVVLIVVSFIGAETVGLIALLVYVAFPAGMAGYLVLIHLLSRPYEEPAASLETDDRRAAPTEWVAEDPRFSAYRRAGGETGVWGFLPDPVRVVISDPVRAVGRRPVLSLWFTLPAAVVVAGLAVATGVASPTRGAFVAAPLRTTVGLVVAPLLTATAPVAVLHTRERRRTRSIAQRFPDVLSILSGANRMGVDLVECLELVAGWTSGELAEELRKVRNDVAWNHDLARALLSFADRLDVDRLTRTMTLVAEGCRSSGDLGGLLEIAAAATRERAKLERARRREVGSYVTIVVVGFLMYLLVIVMVSASYLEPIGELALNTAAPDRPPALANVGAVPVETYRLLFLHSALVQGFGSGLIAGKLAENDLLSGLKYGIALVALAVAAFALFV